MPDNSTLSLPLDNGDRPVNEKYESGISEKLTIFYETKGGRLEIKKTRMETEVHSQN